MPDVQKLKTANEGIVIEQYPLQIRIWARFLFFWMKVPFNIRSPIENVWAFIFRGARSVLKGDTCGSIASEDGIFIEFGGMCPVQGDGTVMGRAAYYRSRGIGWELSIAKAGSDDALADDAWTYLENRYFWPDGGYVDASVSRECILRGVRKWRSAGHP